eukprot:9474873-Lingulodinium_polyedra.AAC.1
MPRGHALRQKAGTEQASSGRRRPRHRNSKGWAQEQAARLAFRWTKKATETTACAHVLVLVRATPRRMAGGPGTPT